MLSVLDIGAQVIRQRFLVLREVRDRHVHVGLELGVHQALQVLIDRRLRRVRFVIMRLAAVIVRRAFGGDRVIGGEGVGPLGLLCIGDLLQIAGDVLGSPLGEGFICRGFPLPDRLEGDLQVRDVDRRPRRARAVSGFDAINTDPDARELVDGLGDAGWQRLVAFAALKDFPAFRFGRSLQIGRHDAEDALAQAACAVIGVILVDVAIVGERLLALPGIAGTLPAGGNINLVISDQIGFLDLARRLCAPFNAQAGYSLMGKLFACRVTVGTPAFTIHSQGKRLPVVSDFVEADTPPPFKRIIMSGNISWRVHDLSNDVAFYATPKERGIYDDAETYREGDIVSIADGSRWIYVNPTATTGNDPVDGSVYWERMSGAATGPQGDSTRFIVTKSATQPSTPDPSSGVPVGWYSSIEDIPASDDPIWSSFGTKLSGADEFTWDDAVQSEGTTGQAGLTISSSPPVATVACTAGGLAKAGELPKSIQVQVLDGDTDVTASCSFSKTDTGSTWSNDGDGAFTLTSVSAEEAYTVITATYGSRDPVPIKISVAQPKDGSAASRATASVTSMNASGTYTAIATVDIVAAAGATISGNASTTYLAASFVGTGTRTVRQQAKVSIQNLTDGGAEVDGSAQIGSAASYIGGDGPSDVGAVSASNSVTNSSGAPKTFRLKFYIRYYDGATTAQTAGGTYSGNIEAQVA